MRSGRGDLPVAPELALEVSREALLRVERLPMGGSAGDEEEDGRQQEEDGGACAIVCALAGRLRGRIHGVSGPLFIGA